MFKLQSGTFYQIMDWDGDVVYLPKQSLTAKMNVKCTGYDTSDNWLLKYDLNGGRRWEF